MTPTPSEDGTSKLVLTMTLQRRETASGVRESALQQTTVQTDSPEGRDFTQSPSSADVNEGVLNCLEMHQQEMEHLNSAIIRQRNEIESLKVAVAESKQTRAETYNHEILEQKLISLERQVHDQKQTSYDADAQAERQLSIYSPTFYSSSTGYKMCCRLYPCGDGNARNTHLSLFFVLMRGEYDDLLTFPFNFRVTFILYDQTGQGRHIIDSFRPDVKSNSFQKPQSSMNTASGIPKFFPLAMLQQDDSPYLRNDMIYIRTIVDFDELPKTVLPYVVSLNPGLPDSLRKKLIQQEIEKRTTTTT